MVEFVKINVEHAFSVAIESICDSWNILSNTDNVELITVNKGLSEEWSKTWMFEMWKVESLIELKIGPWHFLIFTSLINTFEKTEWIKIDVKTVLKLLNLDR